MRILQSPTAVDDNTLKKVTVLVCRTWPNQIKMVSLAFRRIRSQILESTVGKDRLSLCINALFYIEKIKFHDHYLQKQLTQAIAHSIQDDKNIGIAIVITI
jgi:hypothetical protein